MCRILVLFAFFLASNSIKAQINEIGVFIGGSNYIGDIGSTNYIAPNKFAYGLIYKWNKSTRHSYRFSYTKTNLFSNDNKAKASSRIQRGLIFNNSVSELSAGLEFNFFEFDLHKFGSQTTPYLFTGLSYLRYDETYFVNGELKKEAKQGTLAIPIILGLKTRLTNTLILGVEAGVRYSFSDNLDGSFPKDNNLENLRFGNLNSKDWYTFSGITLTYTFGENPCFCFE